jgi:hypothetical protein
LIQIDHQLLVEIGLGSLTQREQSTIQRRIYDVLETRIGVVIGSSLTASQRDVFERLIDEQPEAAHGYLERTIPNYAVVVRNELELILRTIATSLQRGTDRPEPTEGHEQRIP